MFTEVSNFSKKSHPFVNGIVNIDYSQLIYQIRFQYGNDSFSIVTQLGKEKYTVK